MPRWEVCQIQIADQTSGGQPRRTLYEALLFSPTGEHTVIARTQGWTAADLNERQQLNTLIAQLGLDGWEPIPVPTSSEYDGAVRANLWWYFKRQIPDEAT